MKARYLTRNVNPGIFQWAFEKTYSGRAYSAAEPVRSTLSGFLGLPYKYQPRYMRDTKEPVIKVSRDKNVYNWLEQIVFFVPRIGKNFAKLGTEFLPNLAHGFLVRVAGFLLSYKVPEKTIPAASTAPVFTTESSSSVAPSSQNKGAGAWHAFKVYGIKALGLFVLTLSFAPWLIAKVGQSITSPFASIKETNKYFSRLVGRTQLGQRFPKLAKAAGYTAATLRGLFTFAAYIAIAVFAAPLIAVPLAASGSLGSAIVSGLSTAVTWLGSLPVISAIGSAVASAVATVGSAFGLTVASGFATAALVAGVATVATPVLAALKAIVRMLSPFKPSAPKKPVETAEKAAKAKQQDVVIDLRDLSDRKFNTLVAKANQEQSRREPHLMSVYDPDAIKPDVTSSADQSSSASLSSMSSSTAQAMTAQAAASASQSRGGGLASLTFSSSPRSFQSRLAPLRMETVIEASLSRADREDSSIRFGIDTPSPKESKKSAEQSKPQSPLATFSALSAPKTPLSPSTPNTPRTPRVRDDEELVRRAPSPARSSMS